METYCVLLYIRYEFLYIILVFTAHAMTQVVVTSLWPSVIWFKCGLVCVSFVVDKVALGQFFFFLPPLLQFSPFSITLPIPHPCIHLNAVLKRTCRQSHTTTVLCHIFESSGQRSAFTARDQRINSVCSVQYRHHKKQTGHWHTEQTVRYASPNLVS